MRKFLSVVGGGIAAGCSAALAHPDAAQWLISHVGGTTGVVITAILGACAAVHGDSPFKSAK